MGWRAAGTTVVLTLALAGCGSRGLDAGLVASHVKTFEGDDVEVRSCEKTGEAITNNEYGAKLDEVWRCDVKQRDGGSGFAESCYVVYNELESGVVRGIRCAAAGPGCPAGGSGDDRNANGWFLGRVVDPTLVARRGEREPGAVHDSPRRRASSVQGCQGALRLSERCRAGRGRPPGASSEASRSERI
jgi:hypothetical protein